MWFSYFISFDKLENVNIGTMIDGEDAIGVHGTFNRTGPYFEELTGYDLTDGKQ